MSVQELGVDEIAAKLGDGNEEFVANYLQPTVGVEGLKVFFVEKETDEFIAMLANKIREAPNVHIAVFTENRAIASKLAENVGKYNVEKCPELKYVCIWLAEGVILDYKVAPEPEEDRRVFSAFARSSKRGISANEIYVIK